MSARSRAVPQCLVVEKSRREGPHRGALTSTERCRPFRATLVVVDESDHAQDPDRADKRENTYWPSDDASIEELVDTAFADAHLTTEHDIPPQEQGRLLGGIAARVDELATRFERLVGGAVDLSRSAGTVAGSVADIEQLAVRLRPVIAPENVTGTAGEFRNIHYAAYDEYALLLPLSDRIPEPKLRPILQRALDVWIAAQQCLRALGEPLDAD